jgi:hypothetical protein
MTKNLAWQLTSFWVIDRSAELRPRCKKAENSKGKLAKIAFF